MAGKPWRLTGGQRRAIRRGANENGRVDVIEPAQDLFQLRVQQRLADAARDAEHLDGAQSLFELLQLGERNEFALAADLLLILLAIAKEALGVAVIGPVQDELLRVRGFVGFPTPQRGTLFGEQSGHFPLANAWRRRARSSTARASRQGCKRYGIAAFFVASSAILRNTEDNCPSPSFLPNGPRVFGVWRRREVIGRLRRASCPYGVPDRGKPIPSC